MPGSQGSAVGFVPHISHHFHTDNCLHHNMVDMLLHASRGLRALGTNGLVQEKTPQGY